MRTETLGSRWNNMELGGLDRYQASRFGTLCIHNRVRMSHPMGWLALSSTRPNENAPYKAEHYLFLGGPGRNRPVPRMAYSNQAQMTNLDITNKDRPYNFLY